MNIEIKFMNWIFWKIQEKRVVVVRKKRIFERRDGGQ